MILPYMVRNGPQVYVTDEYVASPPALIITDERGDVWTLGVSCASDAPRGEYAYDVLCNGMPTGTTASRIERRNGRIRAFTASGWLRWNGHIFI